MSSLHVDLATQAETFPYAKRRNRNDQAGIWPNHARRRLVDPTAARFYRTCRLSSSTPRGRRFRGKIISSAITSRRFIRRNCLAIRPIVGLDRNRAGGRSGFYFRPRFLFFGHRVASGSPVIIIVALTTKRSGLIRRHALWASRVRATGASVHFR